MEAQMNDAIERIEELRDEYAQGLYTKEEYLGKVLEAAGQGLEDAQK
jgi:hypothetical protein